MSTQHLSLWNNDNPVKAAQSATTIAPKGKATSAANTRAEALVVYKATRSAAFRLLAHERGGVNATSRPAIEAEAHEAGLAAANEFYRQHGYRPCPADGCDRLVTPGYQRCPSHS